MFSRPVINWTLHHAEVLAKDMADMLWRLANPFDKSPLAYSAVSIAMTPSALVLLALSSKADEIHYRFDPLDHQRRKMRL